jgi:uncharacterized membrane protein
MTTTQRRLASSARRLWFVSAGLALFGVLPGLARLLVELAGDPEAVSGTTASPIPVIVHVVSGIAFAVLGAFQFPTARRRRTRSWHRRAGRLLAALGVAAAVSAMWLALFYPRLRHGGELLTVLRLTFGTAMVACIVLGFVAIKAGDIVRHRKWMIRGYAIGLGAATQLFTLGFGGAAFGTGKSATAVLNGAGWVINLAMAEWLIRRRFRSQSRAGAVMVRQQRREVNTHASRR